MQLMDFGLLMARTLTDVFSSSRVHLSYSCHECDDSDATEVDAHGGLSLEVRPLKSRVNMSDPEQLQLEQLAHPVRMLMVCCLLQALP